MAIQGPNSITVLRGGSNSGAFTLQNATGDIDLSTGTYPSGTDGSFTPNPATVAFDWEVTANADAVVGSHPMVIHGSGGTLSANKSTTLVVSQDADYALSASGDPFVIVGASPVDHVYDLDAIRYNGFSETVAFSLDDVNLPAGATYDIEPSTDPATPSISVLTIHLPANAAPAPYSFTVVGLSTTNIERRVNLELWVMPAMTVAFTFTAPDPMGVTKGQDSPLYPIEITRGGFVGDISFSVDGIPEGISYEFADSPVLDGSSSTTLKFTASNDVFIYGNSQEYPITIIGTSGTNVGSFLTNLVIYAPPPITDPPTDPPPPPPGGYLLTSSNYKPASGTTITLTVW